LFSSSWLDGLWLYSDFLLVNHNKAVFFCIFLKLIFNCTNDAFYFLAAKFKQSFSCDFCLVVLGLALLQLFLVVEDLCDCCVVLLEVTSGFTVVKVYQHVCQIAPKLILSLSKLLRRLVLGLLSRLLMLGGMAC
jgi:hypothetical protein